MGTIRCPMPAMLLLELVLLLMICAVALGWLARHFKFPYPIAQKASRRCCSGRIR